MTHLGMINLGDFSINLMVTVTAWRELHRMYIVQSYSSIGLWSMDYRFLRMAEDRWTARLLHQKQSKDRLRQGEMILKNVVQIAEKGLQNTVKPEVAIQRITREVSGTVQTDLMLNSWTQGLNKRL